MIAPYPPKRDGIATYSSQLVTELRRHRPVVVATQAGFGPPPDESVQQVLSDNPLSVLRMVRLVDRLRPAAVHLQFAVPTYGVQALYIYLALAVVRALRRAPIVITLHEVKREIDVLRAVARLLFRLTGLIAATVVVHSSESKRLLERRCGVPASSIEVTPHGVPTQPPATVGDADPVPVTRDAVLFFGYLHPDKGIEYLVQACRLMAERGRPFTLTIAGGVRPRTGVYRLFERRDRRYEARLRHWVREWGLSSRIRFTGFLPEVELTRCIAECAVVVLPYTNVTQSGAANRAIAAGRPIVASAIPGLQGDLEGAAILVPPADPQALAAAITRVLTDPSVAAGLAEAAADRADALALGGLVLSLVRTYERCGGVDVART